MLEMSRLELKISPSTCSPYPWTRQGVDDGDGGGNDNGDGVDDKSQCQVRYSGEARR